jgi:hypothetical protein
VWIGVVANGPSGGVLNSSYAGRSNASYQLELGNAIVNFAVRMQTLTPTISIYLNLFL